MHHLMLPCSRPLTFLSCGHQVKNKNFLNPKPFLESFVLFPSMVFSTDWNPISSFCCTRRPNTMAGRNHRNICIITGFIFMFRNLPSISIRRSILQKSARHCLKNTLCLKPVRSHMANGFPSCFPSFSIYP